MVCYGHNFSNKLNFLATTSLLLPTRSTLSVAQTCNSGKKSFSSSRRVWQQVHKQNSHKTENVYWFSTILMDFYLEANEKSATIAGLRLMLFFFKRKVFVFGEVFMRKTTVESGGRCPGLFV